MPPPRFRHHQAGVIGRGTESGEYDEVPVVSADVRKVFAAAAVLFSVVVATTSCSSTQAKPTPTSPPDRPAYPGLLSAQDQQTIAYRDTLRPLDPCGYLDDAAVHRIGTPAYIGALFDFNACSASFKSPDGDLLGSIQVSMFRAVPGSGTQPEVGEIEVSAGPSEGSCAANVPIDDRVSIMVLAAGKFDSCAVVRDVGRAAVTHRLERPLRATSQRAHMNSRLATLDPCAVLGKIGQGHHPALVANDASRLALRPHGADYDNSANPWECAFLLDRGADSTFQDIRYKFANDSLKADAGSDQKELRIGGLRALENPKPETSSVGSCLIEVSTSPQPAEPGPDRYNPISDAWSSEIISIEAANGCDAARASAEELIRLYNQLPR